jgi:hypothetical protein
LHNEVGREADEKSQPEMGQAGVALFFTLIKRQTLYTVSGMGVARPMIRCMKIRNRRKIVLDAYGAFTDSSEAAQTHL